MPFSITGFGEDVFAVLREHLGSAAVFFSGYLALLVIVAKLFPFSDEGFSIVVARVEKKDGDERHCDECDDNTQEGDTDCEWFYHDFSPFVCIETRGVETRMSLLL